MHIYDEEFGVDPQHTHTLDKTLQGGLARETRKYCLRNTYVINGDN